MTTQRITATKVVLIRAAHDIAPKVIAAALGGLTATQVVSIANDYAHLHLSVGAAGLIVTVLAAVAGYVKADTPLLSDLDRADKAIANTPAATATDAAVHLGTEVFDTLNQKEPQVVNG